MCSRAAGNKLSDRDHQQERQRPPVDTAAVAVIHAQRCHLHILLDVIGELAQLIVDHGGHDRRGPGLLSARGDDVFLQRGPNGGLVDAAIVERDLRGSARLGERTWMGDEISLRCRQRADRSGMTLWDGCTDCSRIGSQSVIPAEVWNPVIQFTFPRKWE